MYLFNDELPAPREASSIGQFGMNPAKRNWTVQQVASALPTQQLGLVVRKTASDSASIAVVGRIDMVVRAMHVLHDVFCNSGAM